MRKALSPTHRELSHINSKIFQAVVLKGTISKNSSPQKGTLGKWENLINRAETPKTSASSSKNASQIQRYNESIQAFRTLNPQLNVQRNELWNILIFHQDEKMKTISKKMINTTSQKDNAGTWSAIISKTATLDDINKLGKKYERYLSKYIYLKQRVFKGKHMESALLPTRERRLLKQIFISVLI